MSWIDNLKTRWKVGTGIQVIVILTVFACTGLTVFFLKKPLFAYFFGEEVRPFWATILYYILILPVYNIFLLFYGFMLGQFRFFWEFEKRFFGRIINMFKSK